MKSRKSSEKISQTSQNNPECTPMLNVNIVNEEIATVSASAVSASAMSISPTVPPQTKFTKLITSNLSLNNRFGSKSNSSSTTNPTNSSTAANLLSSLKSTTLNASKLFNKATSLSRSNSPQTPNSAGQQSKQPIDLEAHIITEDLVNKNGMKSTRVDTSSSESDTSTSDGLGDDTDDEVNRDENSNSGGGRRKTGTKQKKIFTKKSGSLPNSSAKKFAKKNYLKASLYDDEEDDDDEGDNLDSVQGDLDEDCFDSGKIPKKSRLKERRQSKINSAAVARCSLKTMSNLPSNSNLVYPPTLKTSKFTSNERGVDSAILKKDHKEPGDLTTGGINKQQNVIIPNLPPQQQPSTINNSTNMQPPKAILSHSHQPKIAASPHFNQSTMIVANNNNNNNCSVNSSNLNNSRQAVSFSEETLKKDNESSTHLTPNSNKTHHQRIGQVDEEASSEFDLTKLHYDKQDSILSAPVNFNATLEKPNKFLQPLQPLTLTSSFASSTNTGFDSSYSPSIYNKSFDQQHQQHHQPKPQPLAIKVLHKSMTKGSKAMRLMGNNSLLIGNGPLKNSSVSAMSNKSASSFGRSNAAAAAKKLSQKRLFFKNGNINISRSNIDKRRRRYLTDIFTTLIDLKWRYNILVFLLGFFMSWMFFAMVWYFISYYHGDLDAKDNKNHTSCISGIHGFAGAILFSIETQQTIGYGVRYTTEKCPEAIFVMMIQSSVGVMIQSFMVGVVFAKLSRPKKRSETLMFSKNAVISLRDGRLCLICRVGDMRKSHIVEAHVRMYLIKKKVTLEGEILPLHMYDLNVGWDKGLDRLFLVWPLTIEHNIDENSPLWTISAEDLRKERFELAVILEGIVESTGMTTQARSSYLVNEILWGHRFEKLITFQKEDGTYKIDYSRFDMTVPIDTPTCSAKELAELREQEMYFASHDYQDSSPSIFASSNGNGGGDLRKRSMNKTDNEETTNESSTPYNKLVENFGNNAIKMIIEDHSLYTISSTTNEVKDNSNSNIESTTANYQNVCNNNNNNINDQNKIEEIIKFEL